MYFYVCMKIEKKKNNAYAWIRIRDWTIGLYFYTDRMVNQVQTLDWNDTFLNLDHLKSSFPDYTVRIKTPDPTQEPKPPFR